MERVLVNVVLHHMLNWWVPPECQPPFVWGEPVPFVIPPPGLDDGQVCAGGARLVE
jgi:hypothetical protein